MSVFFLSYLKGVLPRHINMKTDCKDFYVFCLCQMTASINNSLAIADAWMMLIAADDCSIVCGLIFCLVLSCSVGIVHGVISHSPQ